MVEGFSDKMSFENILNRLVSNDKVKFMVLSGDITTHSLPQNISKKIAKNLRFCLLFYCNSHNNVVY